MVEFFDKSSLSSLEDVGDMPDEVYYGTSVDESVDDLPLEDDGVEVGKSDDPRVDEDYLRSVAYYESKNAYLRSNPMFREIDTDAFLHLLFSRKNDKTGGELLPFEEEWCEAYEWWTTNDASGRKENRPAKYKYEYNGIAQAIYGKRQKENKNKTFVITSGAERLHEMLEHPFVIMSPISYTGKRRTKNNARFLYAIAIDIDSVDGDNLENLFYQSDPLRKHITFPQPQIVVNSGGGIHIYFLLESPVAMFKDAYPILNKIKKELTRRVWNKGTTHEDPGHPQFQGNCQGFRVPGTQTKTWKPVTAFQNMNPHCKPYYSISDLSFGGGGFLTMEEEELLKKGKYKPNRISVNKARQLYPEWYERRIVLKTPPGRWYVKRDLYDWWRKQIFLHASVGHRYFCLMTLAIFAKKCKQLTYEQFKAVYAERLKGLSERQIMNKFRKRRGVTEEEFKKDLMDFVAVLDGLSVTQKSEDRFTVDDALDAAAAYQETYCTFPMADLRDITGVKIEKNQRRKYKTQVEHLIEARAVRDAHDEKRGHSWNIKRGRKRKQELVFQWRQEHHDETMYSCAKELGISRSTVKQWWNTTIDEIREYEEQRELTFQERIIEEQRKSEIRDLGAAGNLAYNMDKSAITQILHQVPGFEKLSQADQSGLLYDLADTINFSDASLEEMYKAMIGIPEAARPYVHVEPSVLAELRKELSKPYNYSAELENLTEQMAEWPDEMKELYRKQIESYRNKK